MVQIYTKCLASCRGHQKVSLKSSYRYLSAYLKSRTTSRILYDFKELCSIISKIRKVFITDNLHKHYHKFYKKMSLALLWAEVLKIVEGRFESKFRVHMTRDLGW